MYLAERKLGEDADREAVFRQAVVYQTLYSEAASGREHWLYVVVFSFLLWVGAAFYLVFAYFGQKGPLTTSLRLRVVYVPLAVFVYGYLMWLFAMSMS